jgi:hypothetical protein
MTADRFEYCVMVVSAFSAMVTQDSQLTGRFLTSKRDMRGQYTVRPLP